MAEAAKHRSKAKSSMRRISTYKREFDPIIEIYSQLMEQYDTLTEKFILSGFSFDEETANGTKKAPIVTTLESLRRDILNYAAQLGLTPAGLKKFDENAFVMKAKGTMADRIARILDD